MRVRQREALGVDLSWTSWVTTRYSFLRNIWRDIKCNPSINPQILISNLSASLLLMALLISLWHSQTSHSPRWYLHIAGSFHGDAVHARVEVSRLDPKRQPRRHVLHRLHRGVAESDESGEKKNIWIFLTTTHSVTFLWMLFCSHVKWPQAYF